MPLALNVFQDSEMSDSSTSEVLQPAPSALRQMSSEVYRKGWLRTTYQSVDMPWLILACRCPEGGQPIAIGETLWRN